VDIRQGDTVIVISGDEKGKTGRVIFVDVDKNRVVVEKINMIKRHTRPRSQAQSQGGIIEKEAPIHISNVALYAPKAKGATRVKYRVRYEEDAGRKVKVKDRLSVKSGEVIEKPVPKRG